MGTELPPAPGSHPAQPLPDAQELAALLHRCLDGDRSAWNTLVTRFSRLVVSRVGRTFAQFDRPDLQAQADDVAQDVFVSLLEDDYRTLRTLRDPARFPGWLARVARNKAVDVLRQKPARPGALGDPPPPENATYPDPQTDDAEAARHALAREALESLEDRDRLIVELFYFEKRRYREIAQMLNIAENTVASRLYRVKRRLMEQLESKLADEEEDRP